MKPMRLPDNTKAYFIKLGRQGIWEAACIDEGIIRFGYRKTDHDKALAGDWDSIEAFWKEARGKAGTGKNDRRQIQTFYEATSDDLLVTFHSGYLWWCRPCGTPTIVRDGPLANTRVRQTVDGWHKTSLRGNPLLTSTLAGKLTKTQMYRGTICDVPETDYLLRRINDEPMPQVAEAEAAEAKLLDCILPMIRLLDPRDFELMIDLVFSASGWRRQTRTGGTQKTVDLDLLLPSTSERAFVQVKSQTNPSQYREYEQALLATDAHTRMFYVWHSGNVGEPIAARVTLWGPDTIARKVLDAGLLAWLKDRVS